jgi:hypothetical protein
MKVPLNVCDAHEAILLHMTKGISNGRIAESERVGTRVETSSCVIGRYPNLNLGEASGHKDVQRSGKRCLISDMNVGDDTSAILIRVLDHCINRRVKFYGGGMDGVENLSCTHLLDLFRDMVRIESHSGVVARDRIERNNRGIGTWNMPAVFDAAQHSGKVATLLNSQVG